MPTATAIRVDDRPATIVDAEISELNHLLALPDPSPQVLPLPSRPALDQVDPVELALKRVLDITISLFALIVLAPLMLIVALVVRLTSPGPALFLQERVGADGRTFRMIKFRSMRVGTETELQTDELARRRYVKNGFKLAADDPRITRVGRIIRLTSIDELPQLVNVLLGNMSLVGIRPVTADELASRSEYDQFCYRTMKPGMTGLWQVSGRSSVEVDDRHQLDRQYVETWTIWNDAKVLLRTPLAVVNVGNTR